MVMMKAYHASLLTWEYRCIIQRVSTDIREFLGETMFATTIDKIAVRSMPWLRICTIGVLLRLAKLSYLLVCQCF
jgi:hypothetical protein